MSTTPSLLKPEKVYASFGGIGVETAEEYLSVQTRLGDPGQRSSSYNQHSIDDILGNRRSEDMDRGMCLLFATFACFIACFIQLFLFYIFYLQLC